MAKILVYNNYANRMETYYRDEAQAMPYNSNRTLTVDEFRGSSRSGLLWTDRRCMEAWNSFRYIYGRGIYVGYAFKRPWEGGHSNLSQHYIMQLNKINKYSILAITCGIIKILLANRR